MGCNQRLPGSPVDICACCILQEKTLYLGNWPKYGGNSVRFPVRSCMSGLLGTCPLCASHDPSWVMTCLLVAAAAITIHHYWLPPLTATIPHCRPPPLPLVIGEVNVHSHPPLPSLAAIVNRHHQLLHLC